MSEAHECERCLEFPSLKQSTSPALERTGGVALPHAVGGQEAGASVASCSQAEPYVVNDDL